MSASVLVLRCVRPQADFGIIPAIRLPRQPVVPPGARGRQRVRRARPFGRRSPAALRPAGGAQADDAVVTSICRHPRHGARRIPRGRLARRRVARSIGRCSTCSQHRALGGGGSVVERRPGWASPPSTEPRHLPPAASPTPTSAPRVAAGRVLAIGVGRSTTETASPSSGGRVLRRHSTSCSARRRRSRVPPRPQRRRFGGGSATLADPTTGRATTWSAGAPDQERLPPVTAAPVGRTATGLPVGIQWSPVSPTALRWRSPAVSAASSAARAPHR